ncbi:division/cell wall cluster transcriptional repressor MraZ [Acetobacteraceae bacterium]|nr:division/cell wall cluster transcriptional repressor MraZ [Candidatus Parcubacteria bacterium]
MLIGEHRHTLDSKKRLSLPAKFRKEIGKKVIVTRGLDNCLFLFAEAPWKKIVAKLESLPVGSSDSRGLSRFILAGAHEIEVDKAGRILIPDFLKEFAQLEASVVVTGVSDRIEIWNEKAWEEYRKAIEKTAVNMAQALGEVGRF